MGIISHSPPFLDKLQRIHIVKVNLKSFLLTALLCRHHNEKIVLLLAWLIVLLGKDPKRVLLRWIKNTIKEKTLQDLFMELTVIMNRILRVTMNDLQLISNANPPEAIRPDMNFKVLKRFCRNTQGIKVTTKANQTLDF